MDFFLDIAKNVVNVEVLDFAATVVTVYNRAEDLIHFPAGP